MAVDAFLFDESQSALIGHRQVTIDGGGVGGALGGLQVDIGFFQRATQESGIAARRAVARPLLVEHRDASPGPCQRQGRAQARVARSDDDDVVRWRQRARRTLGQRRGLPPIGLVPEVAGQKVFHYADFPTGISLISAALAISSGLRRQDRRDREARHG